MADEAEQKRPKGKQERPLATTGKTGKYRREKPWDHDGIDHWKIEPYTEEDAGENRLVEETSFSTLFPKYREQYLREWWPHVTRELKKYFIDCELDLIEGSMTVRTTRKTWDPYAIINARDLIKLLARSVPFPQAIKIMQDDVACDIIKIGGMVRNKERFIKRRARLIGPNGATLKAIEILTGCYMIVQGNTVACMGDFKGLKQIRRVVEDCMNNIHPVYNIKALMIKRELMNNPEMKEESWDRFLPKFKKQNVKQKKKVSKKKKKDDNPFPPPQQPSKIDLQIESGEYFLKPAEREAKKLEQRKAASAAASAKKQAEREKAFVAPKEPVKRKAEESASSGVDGGKLDVEALKKKLKTSSKSKKSASKAEDFVIGATDTSNLSDKKKKKKKSKNKESQA